MPITGKKISLYFHIPFCKTKCPYCRFYSIFHNETLEKLYLESIKKHYNIYEPIIKKNSIISIYFGGGTPSLLNIQTLKQILELIDLPKNIEITIEVNPEDISYKKIKAYKDLQINRASIGVQSFDENLLKILGRRHSVKKARDVILAFHENGLENISIDLMYDIIRQNINSWKNTLKEISSLPITHISLYNLIFEKHTMFYKNKKKLLKFVPNEKDSLSMLNLAISEFKKLKFHRYEISAFAKIGYNSVHNTGYWTGRDFLGFGPSAFSYFNKKRFQNICSLENYAFSLKNDLSFIEFEESLQYPQNINELIAINLRLLDGIDIKSFEKNFGPIPLDTMQILKNSSFVNFKNSKIKLNNMGLLFYDTLASEII